ncbi:hypothetical protein [Homoserinimonas hongtaonis]|uniref:SAF domain-containing protein n=1 Tax=Homoserinimonas hongtaonis TaxID=2079791 RepID=A0A2U1SWS9_9MICO|nr:hypothetical protein [Salinibacterium hongtaonis]PWB96087.1 hypothetical protein DF220_11915 [Salinibacterium hongtaonis]
MSTLAAHDRGRAPRSHWFDVRLAVGVVLIGASIAGVMLIVGSSDNSVTVYSSDRTLSAGDIVSAGDLVETRVRLGESAGHYLRPGDIDDGVVVARTVGKGELVPLSAVGSLEGSSSAAIVVSVAGVLPRSVREGSVVDLWAAEGDRDDESESPTVVASGVTVVRVSEADGMIAGSQTQSVEVLVSRDRIARILEAKAAGASLALIPTTQPIKG